jgi:hypothetical protein
VLSGATTLISGTLATAIFVELLGSTFIKVASAGLIFLSGFTALIVNACANNKDTEIMFEGAAQFLSIRDQCIIEARKTNSSSASQMNTSVAKIHAQYIKPSNKYDRYTGIPDDSFDYGKFRGFKHRAESFADREEIAERERTGL